MVKTFKDAFGAILKSTTFIDVSEFLSHPARAGVQRSTFELLRRWPDRRALPICLPGNGMVAILDPSLGEAIAEFFADDRRFLRLYRRAFGYPERAQSQAETMASARFALQHYRDNPLALVSEDAFAELLGAVVNTELFFDPKRIAFYERLVERAPDRIFFLNHDFLPFLNPEVDPGFDFGADPGRMRYLHLLRKLRHLSFNSGATKAAFSARIARAEADGPIFRPGADGLGPRRASPALPEGPPSFVVFGTIEGRKRPLTVLRALARLFANGADLRAYFVGAMVRLAAEEEREFRAAIEAEPRLQWIEAAGDRELAALVGAARATIFASSAEGYGMPPLESLALGVPAIISARLPSFEGMPKGGYLCCEGEEEGLAGAIAEFLADDFALAKRREIDALILPSWAEFAAGIALWVEESGALAKPGEGQAASAEEIAAFRGRLDLVHAFSDLAKLGVEDAIHDFYRTCLKRSPSAAQFNDWCELAERTEASARSLLLGLLTACRKECEAALAIGGEEIADMIGAALDASGHYADWAKIPLSLAKAEALRSRLWRVARAVELDGEGFVEIARQSLFEDALPGETIARWKEEAGRQPIGVTFAEVSKRADWRPLREDSALEARYLEWRSLLAETIALPQLDAEEMIDRSYRLFLKRPPDAGGLKEHLTRLAEKGDRWARLAAFIYAEEFRRRPYESDLRSLLAAAVEAGKRRRDFAARLLRRLQGVCHLDAEAFGRTLAWVVGGRWPQPSPPQGGALGGTERIGAIEDALAQPSLLSATLDPPALAKLRSWTCTLARLELGQGSGDGELLAAGLDRLGYKGEIPGAALGWPEIGAFALSRLGDEANEEPGLLIKVVEASRFPFAEVARVFALCRDLAGVFHLPDEAIARVSAERLALSPRPGGAAGVLFANGRELHDVILDQCVEGGLLAPNHAGELARKVESWVAILHLHRSPAGAEREAGAVLLRALLGPSGQADGAAEEPPEGPYQSPAELLESPALWQSAADLFSIALADSLFGTAAQVARPQPEEKAAPKAPRPRRRQIGRPTIR